MSSPPCGKCGTCPCPGAGQQQEPQPPQTPAQQVRSSCACGPTAAPPPQAPPQQQPPSARSQCACGTNAAPPPQQQQPPAQKRGCACRPPPQQQPPAQEVPCPTQPQICTLPQQAPAPPPVQQLLPQPNQCGGGAQQQHLGQDMPPNYSCARPQELPRYPPGSNCTCGKKKVECSCGKNQGGYAPPPVQYQNVPCAECSGGAARKQEENLCPHCRKKKKCCTIL